jgi:uncharacterized protein YndB with AHSA1/START domain
MDTHNVNVTRRFDASIERVWRAWVEPELVMQWWGPAGFTCARADMDFREGGTSLVCMRAPAEFGGGDIYNTWTYTEIVPLQRFEYVLRFSDADGTALDPATLGLPPGIPKEVRNRNVFADLGEGRMELTITEFGYASPEAAEISRMGLEQCLDKMEAVLARAPGIA